MKEKIEKARAMAASLKTVDRIVEKFDRNEAKLIPILQAVQEEFNYLSPEAMSHVANCLGVPISRVYGVATFYAHFSLSPKGKHIFRLCDGTACHVKKSHDILEALRAKLGLDADHNTTGDLMFTIETVSCLGACGLAPVMVADSIVHGQATPAVAAGLVDQIRELEKQI